MLPAGTSCASGGRLAWLLWLGVHIVYLIGSVTAFRSSSIGGGTTSLPAAADQLAGDGIRARIVDLYSVKPIDTQTLLQAAAATGDRVVVAEDHYPAGGIGSAVLNAFNDAGHPVQLSHLAVRDLADSGTPAELMATAGISADQIAQAARDLLSG